LLVRGVGSLGSLGQMLTLEMCGVRMVKDMIKSVCRNIGMGENYDQSIFCAPRGAGACPRG